MNATVNYSFIKIHLFSISLEGIQFRHYHGGIPVISEKYIAFMLSRIMKSFSQITLYAKADVKIPALQ